jgi:hypothetical protein
MCLPEQSARDAVLAELAAVDPTALDAAGLMGEISELTAFISQAQAQPGWPGRWTRPAGRRTAATSRRRHSCAPGAVSRPGTPPRSSRPAGRCAT